MHPTKRLEEKNALGNTKAEAREYEVSGRVPSVRAIEHEVSGQQSTKVRATEHEVSGHDFSRATSAGKNAGL